MRVLSDRTRSHRAANCEAAGPQATRDLLQNTRDLDQQARPERALLRSGTENVHHPTPGGVMEALPVGTTCAMTKPGSSTCPTCGTRLFAGACLTCPTGIASSPR